MNTANTFIEAALQDALLSLDELCRASAVSPQWVQERVSAGLLCSTDGEPGLWRFDVRTLHRVRRMARLERDFDAVPELAALVADLEGEIARLRGLLKRGGG